MKKESKKQIMVLLIVLIFFGSTFAYVILSTFKEPEKPNEMPTSYILNYRLNETIEAQLLSRGFTSVQYFYKTPNSAIISYLDKIPEDFKIIMGNQEQIQTYVQKINYTYNNTDSYIAVKSIANQIEIIDENITEKNIYEALCKTVISPPGECGLIFINQSLE